MGTKGNLQIEKYPFYAADFIVNFSGEGLSELAGILSICLFFGGVLLFAILM